MDGQSNPSMPPGIIIPVLAYPDINRAVKWLCETFGFKERLRIGNHRVQLTFGDASVVVIGGASQTVPDGTSCELMVVVADVDGHYAHVKESGANIVNPPETYPFGERQYTVEDLAGRHWTFTQSVANVAPEEWSGVMIF
ncbi:MAG: VOC family protein [Chloroflexi bacterium]|nr:VOC family protein [Chloroflexota bacterium]